MENTRLELYHASCRVSSEFYLRDIDLKLSPGEAVAIMGKNASGKSTLFSMLMGIFPLTAGEILLDGKKVALSSPKEATAQGIMLLGQNQPLFENMKVYENMYFGQELTLGKMLDNKRMCREAQALLAQLNIPVSPMAEIRQLGHARRQLIQLARAVCSGARMILLDEPSTHLDAADKNTLWKTVCALKEAGKSLLFISHDPAEVLAMADRVAFMEAGVLSQTLPVGELDEDSLAAKAYDISPGHLYARAHGEPGETVLQVVSQDVNFCLRRGEVVALLGDSAFSQSFLGRLAGLAPFQGTITVNGAALTPTPLSGIENGVSLALDDQAEEEIAQARELLDNGARNNARTRATFQMRRLGSSLSGAFNSWIGMGRKGEYITGGNRRRELMERALGRRAALYLLMEPSAGMDIPTRMRMYGRFGQIAQEGAAILFATGNISEALGLADRLLVVREGKLLQDIPAGGDPAAIRALLE